MKYGEYSSLVEEVINYIQSNQLFQGNKQLDDEFTIIDDFEQAQEIAWTQDLDIVDTLWEYVKSSEDSEIIGKVYEKELRSVERELKELFDSTESYSEGFFPSGYLDIIEEVQGDLFMCAINRLVNGKTNNFYEELFRIYQSGGWPCGWEGKYPEGRIITFIPVND
ncbi:hypothetical protein [Paenibacillus fonticola]|uniref:hypothetical protein n=1 Tax=Paenibacillus fonticola TaxID=379896 RepID=UPI00036DADBE|nr:hypothetical protein [Paenibacillus fonticola]